MSTPELLVSANHSASLVDYLENVKTTLIKIESSDYQEEVLLSLKQIVEVQEDLK